MRIAVTGAHGTGKSTLVGDFTDLHPAYEHREEPYWELAQQGVVFAGGPVVADLVEQLEQSCRLVLESAREHDVIFDRCPIDFVAYLEVVSAKEGEEWSPTGRQLTSMEKALTALDLIVFVPITQPDEIAAKIEFPKLRRAVDNRLRRILLEDELGLLAVGPRVVEVTGSRDRRVATLSTLAAGGASP
jgi:hypothetical protein